MQTEREEWDDVVRLVDAVMSDDDLVPAAVREIRMLMEEVATLTPADMAGQTRAVLAAATRAVADRRGPSESELSFVADLAVTRARQGIPIEVVLAAIRVSERAIWARARELSVELGIDPLRVLDARELYDDWAEAVRGRLIRAHREVRTSGPGADREIEVVRRLLGGGTAAALAAAEAGLTDRPVWVAAADGDSLSRLRRLVGTRPDAWAAYVGEVVVAITARRPVSHEADDHLVGVAGPVPVEEIAAAHRLAVAAIEAGRSTGRTGLVDIPEVAVPAALLGREDLGAALRQRHSSVQRSLGAQADAVSETVRAWLLRGRDTEAAAAALFVHANTVRNRVQRFTEVTGLDLADPLAGAQAWWLCELWREQSRPERHTNT